MKRPFLFFIMILIMSCGDGSSGSNTETQDILGEEPTTKSTLNKFNSKISSPNTKVDDKNSVASKSEKPKPKDDADESAQETSACLTGSCSTPQNLQIAFSQPIPISPYECSTINNLEVIDFNSHLWIFSSSSCASASTYLYMEQRSYSGEILSAPVLLSKNCSTSSNYVSEFAVSHNGSSILVVYSCYVKYNSYRIDSLTLDTQGIPSTAKTVVADTSNRYISLTWNSEAGTYGLARSNQFLRLASDGAIQGGPIVIPSNPITQVKSINGHWIILQNSGTSSYPKTSCSKVSSLGTLLCTGKELGSGEINLTSTDQLLRMEGTYYNGLQVSTLDFTIDTCSSYNESNSVSPLNAPSSQYDNILYDSAAIYNNTQLNLFQGKYGLILGTYKRDSTLKLLTEISLDEAGLGAITQGNIEIFGEHLNVYYVKDSRGYIVVSQQKVDN